MLYSQGILDDEPAPNGDKREAAIESLIDDIHFRVLSVSKDGEWLSTTHHLFSDCIENLSADLTLGQTSIYLTSCIRWCWFADCDRHQEADGSLDAPGAQRRASFFSSECPLSPQTVRQVLEAITGRTFQQCGLDSPATGDAEQRYEASIDKMICLLENFQSGSKLNYSGLKNAIAAVLTGPSAEHARLLLEMVRECENIQKSKDFVRCWASFGVFRCAFQEANQMAAKLPDKCRLAV